MAAGQGFKTFATGDVLSAADVNGYLMQGVLVFATAAARDAAITAPAQGQTAYLKSDNLIYTYNGSAWTNSVGDITAVTTASNSGLAGGATAGAVALTLNTAAKGDLLAGTGSGTAAALTVGTNDLLLTAASGETTGLKYTGGWTTWTPTIAGVTLGNGTVTARYCQIGKIVHYAFYLLFGTTSIATGDFSITVPVTPSNVNLMNSTSFAYNGGTFYVQSPFGGGTNQVYSRAGYAAASYVFGTTVSATAPFTWGSGSAMQITGYYEVA